MNERPGQKAYHSGRVNAYTCARGGRIALLRLLLCFPLLLLGCARPYQVGDHVLVEWGREGRFYPGFIVEKKSRSTYRVHYEGYPVRWDEDVSLPRIKGRVTGPVTQPPPPKHVRIAQGLDLKQEGESSQLGRYKRGDRIRVRWRGTVYRATVLQVASSTEFKVHYDGHEDAWDEVVPVSRIVTSP